MLDLESGYLQNSPDPESREKTAFVAGDLLYAYNTLPIGLKNAHAHLSRAMMSVFYGLVASAVLICLADIIIVGNSVEEHLENFIKVLEA